MRRTCPKYGAAYELAECKTIVRDKDSLECNFCNETIIKLHFSLFYVKSQLNDTYFSKNE